MEGHVFVVRGDLTSIECDAWLLPSSRHPHIEAYWTETATGAVVDDLREGVLERALPDGWPDRVRTCLIAGWWADDGPATWMTDVGGGQWRPVEWFVDGVAAFVAAASAELRRTEAEPRNRRSKHLLALPVVGTGHGGGAERKGEIVGQLLPALEELAREHDVDIALVAWDAQSFAAAQGVRRRRLRTAAEALEGWSDLSPQLVACAESLGRRAVARDLVLFLGAGVSAAAGLPLWQGLLDRIAQAAGLDESQVQQLSKLDVLDQARLLHARFDEEGRSLGELVAALVEGRRYALTHALIASLPSREVITVNYDQLFEHASRDAEDPPVVLPYDAVEAGARWLLKLHGSVDHPEDIVLTRSDYLRYSDRRAALAGIVQALLITRHMLFIGFSLTDDNFNRIAEDVRRAIRGEVAPEEPQLGTALLLHEDPMMVELWKHDLACVPMAGPADAPEPAAARRLEVFLDCLLAYASTNASHVMDPTFSTLLTDDERELRDLLVGLESASEGLRSSPMWAPVRELLERFGQEREDRHA